MNYSQKTYELIFFMMICKIRNSEKDPYKNINVGFYREKNVAF